MRCVGCRVQGFRVLGFRLVGRPGYAEGDGLERGLIAWVLARYPSRTLYHFDSGVSLQELNIKKQGTLIGEGSLGNRTLSLNLI